MTHDKSFRILILENESLIEWSLMNALKKAGYDSHIVDSPEEAVRCCNDEDYDLLIGELQLLNMDEPFMSHSEKSDSHHPPLIIIGTREEIALREGESGPLNDFYLEKPFNVKELLALVRRILAPAGAENPDQT